MGWMFVKDANSVLEEVYVDKIGMMLAFSTQFKSYLILFFRGMTLSFLKANQLLHYNSQNTEESVLTAIWLILSDCVLV